MIIVVFFVVGIVFGSFINALVWRIHKHEELKDRSRELTKKHKTPIFKLQTPNYSVLTGRSMCPNCQHLLAAKDLVPVFSWLFLKRRCRYCKKPISWQYPVVELLTAALFVVSYIAWPASLLATHYSLLAFITWLIILVGLIAMAVYDVKWMTLPDKIIFPLAVIALLSLVLQLTLGRSAGDLYGIVGAVAIGGGIFWILFQLSKGKWIGGGDVKLGFLLGLLVAKPEYAFMYLFFASILAMLFSLPLMAIKKLTPKSKIPFGPFLIAAAIIVMLFGSPIIDAYKTIFGL